LACDPPQSAAQVLFRLHASPLALSDSHFQWIAIAQQRVLMAQIRPIALTPEEFPQMRLTAKLWLLLQEV